MYRVSCANVAPESKGDYQRVIHKDDISNVKMYLYLYHRVGCRVKQELEVRTAATSQERKKRKQKPAFGGMNLKPC